MASHPALDITFAAGPGAGALQDLLYAELDDFSPLAIHEFEGGDGWRVFFRTASVRDAAREALAASLGGHVLDLSPIDVEDEDWARRSQSALQAVRIGRVVVAPPWDVPSPSPDTELVVIEPSTGFGTGHHATTRMCLELLQTIDLSGKRVADVGTGSGVLAIAAWKCGAADVVALDNDPEALANTRDNVARNGAIGPVQILEGDIEHLSLPPADLVLANLTGPMLQRCSAALMALAVPGGTAILSGFGPEDSHPIASAWSGWSVRDRRRDGDWAAIALTSRGV